MRDVYLGGLFQRVSPLLVAIVAFTLCTIVLLPATAVGSRNSLVVFQRRPHDLLWVNVTSASARRAFLYALRLVEPPLVQILYSGIGLLSVVWIERHLRTPEISVTSLERLAYFGLLASLIFSAGVALGGLSGARAVGPRPQDVIDRHRQAMIRHDASRDQRHTLVTQNGARRS